MFLETRAWNALNIVAILMSALVPLYVSLYTPNTFTQKRLQSFSPVTSDVTGAFAAFRELGNDIHISVTNNDFPIDNLAVSVVGIKNTGSVAIIPSDFYENLSINVDGPWRILAVKTTASPEPFIWTKITNQRFEMPAQLLNPGDELQASVYATNTRYTQSPHSELTPYWSAHVLNMQTITKGNINKVVPIAGLLMVYLYGWSLIATLGGTIFLLIIYLNLLYRLEFIQSHRWSSVGAIIVSGIISLSSSEAMATYLVPNALYSATGVSNLYNLPPILINIVALGWLSFKAWRIGAEPPPELVEEC
jgi:hypothetical protein